MADPQALREPLPLESLPPQLRRHLDPGAPDKLRMMAAKGLVPVPPAEQVKALYVLSQDPDASVRESAMATATSLPERILGAVLRGELPPPVLDFLAERLEGNETALELVLLNPATADGTFVRLAATVPERLLGIVAENQLRLLREPDIIRALHGNPHASRATLDRVVDFAVRSGLNLPDLESYQEARRRILGEEADRTPTPEETAEGLIEANKEVLSEEFEEELPEVTRMTLQQQILQMTVSEKIKLATLGNKEARTILLRDPNKLVQEAAIQSPRITDGEVVGLTNSRTLPDSVLRIILNNREWMKIYQVKVNLVNNPKTPLPTAIRMLPYLRANDLKALARNRNVANALATQAKLLMNRKGGGR